MGLAVARDQAKTSPELLHSTSVFRNGLASSARLRVGAWFRRWFALLAPGWGPGSHYTNADLARRRRRTWCFITGASHDWIGICGLWSLSPVLGGSLLAFLQRGEEDSAEDLAAVPDTDLDTVLPDLAVGDEGRPPNSV